MIGKLVFGLIKQQVINILFILHSNGIIIKEIVYNEGRFIKARPYLKGKLIVRLNLINHVLALFRDKFACNTALRNPVFKWESCKGSV